MVFFPLGESVPDHDGLLDCFLELLLLAIPLQEQRVEGHFVLENVPLLVLVHHAQVVLPKDEGIQFLILTGVVA